MKRLISDLKCALKETRGQAESNTLYMLLIVVIVAIILIAVVKPMFNNSVKASAKKAALPSNTVTGGTTGTS
ncbi:MAG: hypothetical protein WCF78_01575 [archaeon]